jgi:uncharacterized CHY-type Zn-finger protein
MPDNFICIIPRDPLFIPDIHAQQQAQQLFHQFAPHADEITFTIKDTPTFVDAGANFTFVACSRCHQRLDTWWQEAMDRAAAQQFHDLDIVTPCCGATLSLNALHYEWPCGFARFVLEAQNPQIGLLSVNQVRELERVLDCKLRQILVHI